MALQQPSQRMTTLGNHHHETREHSSHDRPHVGTGSLQAEALAIMAELVIIGLALAALAVGIVSRQPELGDLAINFVAIILEPMPFMMVGAVIVGIIEVFVLRSLSRECSQYARNLACSSRQL